MLLDDKLPKIEIQSDLKEMTNQISNGINKFGNYNFIGDKLVSCVQMIKYLIQLNEGLRLSFDEANLKIKKFENKNQSLEEENVELRERIEMLESILVKDEIPNKEKTMIKFWGKLPKIEKFKPPIKSKSSNLLRDSDQSILISKNYYNYHSKNIHH